MCNRFFETDFKTALAVSKVMTCRRACGHVDVGTCPHQVLAATLTLSQPGGADYAPASVLAPPYVQTF